MSDAKQIAQALHGRPCAGGWLCRCPAPGHGRGRGDRNPSLFVKDGDRQVLVTCFAGCQTQDVLDRLRRIGLLEKAALSARRVARQRPLRRVHVARPDATALDLWSASLPLPGTVADRYLQVHRGLSAPFPPTLRFLPGVLHPHVQRRYPALIAASQTADGSLAAAQLTFLTADGAKAALKAPRLTFGLLGDGAIRLAEPTNVLGLAEGTEDALSAIAERGCPCWAAAGGGRLHRVAVPNSVREVHIFADDDCAGELAAARTSLNHRSLGRRVVVHLPPAGLKDWGEVAQAKRAESRAA